MVVKRIIRWHGGGTWMNKNEEVYAEKGWTIQRDIH